LISQYKLLQIIALEDYLNEMRQSILPFKYLQGISYEKLEEFFKPAMEKACLNKESQGRLKPGDRVFLESFQARWFHTRITTVEA
jgi:hypothetical protein